MFSNFDCSDIFHKKKGHCYTFWVCGLNFFFNTIIENVLSVKILQNLFYYSLS